MFAYPQLNRARVFIFDVDGTLYDARRLKSRMLVELLLFCLADPRRVPQLRILQVYRREREKLADQEASDIVDLQYRRPADRLGISSQQVESVVTQWIHQRPLRHLEAVRIVGVRRFFNLLRTSGRSLAVLSDYPALEKLGVLGLAADRIVVATDSAVNRLKPHPAGLQAAISRLDVDPADCLLIGDRDARDGEVARRCGVPYLLRVARVEDPDREFADYLQLLTRFA
jgi:phosphoglycolate phosphatase/putative hydrolase of the HAD superfamily